MKLSMTIKELLSSTKTKRQLTIYFAERPNLVVVYENKRVGTDINDIHSHEKADVLLAYQIIFSLSLTEDKEYFVWSPDTDILMILMHVVASAAMPIRINLIKRHNIININERVDGQNKSR